MIAVSSQLLHASACRFCLLRCHPLRLRIAAAGLSQCIRLALLKTKAILPPQAFC
jgi:hypothetical protein